MRQGREHGQKECEILLMTTSARSLAQPASQIKTLHFDSRDKPYWD